MRKQTSTISDIAFSIVKRIDKTNKSTSIYFEINDKLSDFINDNLKWPVQRIIESGAKREKQALTDNKNNIQLEVMDE